MKSEGSQNAEVKGCEFLIFVSSDASRSIKCDSVLASLLNSDFFLLTF